MEHQITALRVQKKNPQRVNVYLDGEFAFGLARIVAAWLQVGQTLSDEKITELRGDDEREKAYQKALNLLSYRPRSEAEILRNLKEHDITDETAQGVLGRLKEAGLVDDRRFAQTWVENRNELRPRGRRLLAYELRQRGLERDVVDATLESVDDAGLAYQAAQKQARRYREANWQDFRKKMIAFLARRGFDYESSSSATARVWAELNEEDPSE